MIVEAKVLDTISSYSSWIPPRHTMKIFTRALMGLKVEVEGIFKQKKAWPKKLEKDFKSICWQWSYPVHAAVDQETQIFLSTIQHWLSLLIKDEVIYGIIWKLQTEYLVVKALDQLTAAAYTCR
jgi:hypothetical protein